MAVIFEDNSAQVKAKINRFGLASMTEVVIELESAVKRNTAVKTGQTKNSWTHHVVGDVNSGTLTGIVGSNYMNAIWEEYGTGEYALEGNGRKGGWRYVDAEGKGHFTRGKRPRRAFYNAYTANKAKLIQRLQQAFAGI